MNIIDNSPIEAPSVGRIVTETYEVEQVERLPPICSALEWGNYSS